MRFPAPSIEQILERFDEKPKVFPEKSNMAITKVIAGPDTYQGQGRLRTSIIVFIYHDQNTILFTSVQESSLQPTSCRLQFLQIDKCIFRNQKKRPAVERQVKKIW